MTDQYDPWAMEELPPFTGEEVWHACKDVILRRKLEGREEAIKDTFDLARILDSRYPSDTYTGGRFHAALVCAHRVVPGLRLLNKIELIEIDDEVIDTWEDYIEWELHPKKAEFIAGKPFNVYLLDATAKSFSISPGINEWAGKWAKP